MAQDSHVQKLLGNFWVTSDIISNFSPVEQLLMNRATFKLYCLDGHTPAPEETSRDCRMQLVSRLSLSNLLVVIVCYTFSSIKNKVNNKHEADIR